MDRLTADGLEGLVCADRLDEAKLIALKILALNPNENIAAISRSIPLVDENARRIVFSSLEKAGIPAD